MLRGPLHGKRHLNGGFQLFWDSHGACFMQGPVTEKLLATAGRPRHLARAVNKSPDIGGVALEKTLIKHACSWKG